MGLFKDIKALLSGMMITSKHLGRHAITLQYPEERWEMPERSRGIVVLLSDKEDGSLNCTACELCAKACPTAAIIIDAPRGEDKKKVLKKFELDYGLCCFCGMCEEACNFSALKLTGKYEFSTVEKADLIWDVNKLQEIGRDVPYEDKRKKKPVKKVAPKPAADTTTDADAKEQATPAVTPAPAASNPDSEPNVEKIEQATPDEEKKPVPPAPAPEATEESKKEDKE